MILQGIDNKPYDIKISAACIFERPIRWTVKDLYSEISLKMSTLIKAA